jgi:hypothetical protein
MPDGSTPEDLNLINQDDAPINTAVAIKDFKESVLSTLPQADQIRLRAEQSQNIDDIVDIALDNLDQFQDGLKDLIHLLFYKGAEVRFIRNPRDDGILFVDSDNELITMKGVELDTSVERMSLATKTTSFFSYVKKYDNYEVLTGENKGRTFTPTERPLAAPKPPVRQLQMAGK